MRSRPETTSGLSVDASASSGNRNAGRKLAKRSRSLRRRSSAAPGRLSYGNLLVAGNAARAEQDRLGLARDRPACAAAEDRHAIRSATPPIGASTSSSGAALPTAARSTFTACAVTSAPMPSPASTAIFIADFLAAMPRFVRLDRGQQRERVADLVQAFEQAVLRERVDLERVLARRRARARPARGRSTTMRAPGCASSCASRRPTAGSGSTIGRKPFFSAFDAKMSPNDGAIAARKPWSYSAHTACSRELPQPKLRSATTMRAPRYASRLKHERRDPRGTSRNR